MFHSARPLGQHEALVLFVLLPGLGVDFGQMLNLVAGLQVEVDASDVALPVAFDGVAEEHRALQPRRLDDVADLERVLHLGRVGHLPRGNVASDTTRVGIGGDGRLLDYSSRRDGEVV